MEKIMLYPGLFSAAAVLSGFVALLLVIASQEKHHVRRNTEKIYGDVGRRYLVLYLTLMQ